MLFYFNMLMILTNQKLNLYLEIIAKNFKIINILKKFCLMKLIIIIKQNFIEYL